MPLRILITNAFIHHRTGSELYVRDLALELRRRGHEPVVYSPRLGPLAEEIRRRGIAIVDDLDAIADEPDVIHGHHHPEVVTASMRFPSVPIVSVCHGVGLWMEAPARLPQIMRYVAVSEPTRDRLVLGQRIPEELVRVVPNFVDLERFPPRRDPLPKTPRRALVLSNQLSDANWLPAIRAACRAQGLLLEVGGMTVGKPLDRPEDVLHSFDVVLGRGRSALEALATGCAVVLCDVEGLGPMVTAENLDRLWRQNLGAAAMEEPITAEGVAARLAAYDPARARAASARVRAEGGVDRAVAKLLEIYDEAIAAWRERGPPSEAEQRKALRRYLTWVSASVHEDLLIELARAQTSAANQEAQMEVLRSGLPWRALHRLSHAPGVRPAYRFARELERVVRFAVRSRLGPRADRAALPEHPASLAPSASAARETPRLACVVLSLKDQSGTLDAVRSLAAQSEPVEIVVVNSGGGDPTPALREAGLDVLVLNARERLFPGGARNLGLAATSAPYVAFLAADCIAEPGWAEERLRLHDAGASAVSSAIVNPRPWSTVAVASYVTLFHTRMPNTPPDQVVHYGASYDRSLFDELGGFREDLRAGEDTELHRRAEGRISLAWGRCVRTAHAPPRSVAALLQDHFKRGARMVATYAQLDGGAPRRSSLAVAVVRRLTPCLQMSWRASETPTERRRLAAASPFVVAAHAAMAAGALVAPSSSALPSSAPRPAAPQISVRRSSRLLALLVFRNEMRFLPGYFANVAPHVDGIVALDDGSTDGSTDFVASQPSVLELIRLPPRVPHEWNDAANHRRLIEAACGHRPDWLVAVDADERLERSFRLLAELDIERADALGLSAFALRLRELWNRPDTFRVDGIWGGKRVARLFRARHDHVFDERRLHCHWASLDSVRSGAFPPSDATIYHLRMIEPADREQRRRRYEALDPTGEHQAIGYAYLTSEQGLRLERITAGREWDSPAVTSRPPVRAAAGGGSPS